MKLNPNTIELIKHIKQNIDRQIDIVINHNYYNYIVIHNKYYHYDIGYEIISDDVLSEIITYLVNELEYYPNYYDGNLYRYLYDKCDIKIHITDYNLNGEIKPINVNFNRKWNNVL